MQQPSGQDFPTTGLGTDRQSLIRRMDIPEAAMPSAIKYLGECHHNAFELEQLLESEVEEADLATASDLALLALRVTAEQTKRDVLGLPNGTLDTLVPKHNLPPQAVFLGLLSQVMDHTHSHPQQQSSGVARNISMYLARTMGKIEFDRIENELLTPLAAHYAEATNFKIPIDETSGRLRAALVLVNRALIKPIGAIHGNMLRGGYSPHGEVAAAVWNAYEYNFGDIDETDDETAASTMQES